MTVPRHDAEQWQYATGQIVSSGPFLTVLLIDKTWRSVLDIASPHCLAFPASPRQLVEETEIQVNPVSSMKAHAKCKSRARMYMYRICSPVCMSYPSGPHERMAFGSGSDGCGWCIQSLLSGVKSRLRLVSAMHMCGHALEDIICYEQTRPRKTEN